MEPISFFLDSFIQLAQRIINLEKTKREDKQQVFKEIIEPLFVQLQPVAENYLLMFRKARQSVINNPDSDLSKALDEIRESRDQMQLARSIVQKMATQISSRYRDKEINEFANNVLGFFDVSLDGQAGEGTISKQLERIVERVLTKRADRMDLHIFIFTSLEKMEEYWGGIGQSYADAKIYCLSAPQLLKKPR